MLAACVLSAGAEAAGFTLTWNNYGQPFGHNIVAYCGVNNAAPYEVTSVAATETEATFALPVNPGDKVACHLRALRLKDLVYSGPTPVVRYIVTAATAASSTSSGSGTTTTPTPTTVSTPSTSSGGTTTTAPTATTSTTTAPATTSGSTTVLAGTTNAPPVISGTPPTRVAYGASYYFRPTVSDADGDVLYFDITNRPAWAEFNATTGELRGLRRMTAAGWSERPASYDVGVTTGIVITVSDGRTTRSLPAFSIEVYDPNAVTATTAPATTGTTTTSPTATAPTTSTTTQPSQPSGTVTIAPATSTTTTPSTTTSTTNTAPIISGTPMTMARANMGYLFIPYARDPDYDTLFFSIQNKPSWAEFNTETGELRGMRRMTPAGWVKRPSAADVGTYPNIIISVTDGNRTTSLPPFSITVTY